MVRHSVDIHSPCLPRLPLQVTKGFKRISPFFIPYAITNMGSGLLAMEHGFMGPNYSVSTGEGD